jgi:hypothetical protein
VNGPRGLAARLGCHGGGVAKRAMQRLQAHMARRQERQGRLLPAGPRPSVQQSVIVSDYFKLPQDSVVEIGREIAI